MIIFHCALRAEAECFIETLGLKRDLSFKGFELFYNADFLLIISGIGKLATATALGAVFNYALNKVKQNEILAVNFGSAGGLDIEIGELVLPLKISNQKMENFYPEILCQHNFITSTLITSESPVSSGLPNCIYDMEGSAFFDAASNFLDSHQILSIKIISDNLAPQKFSLNHVRDLISAKFSKVLDYARDCEALINSENNSSVPEEISELTVHLSLTSSQKRILNAKINQLKVLGGETSTLVKPNSNSSNSKDVFNQLIEQLDTLIEHAAG